MPRWIPVVHEGGKKSPCDSAPAPQKDFDAASFLVTGESFDYSKFKVTPDMYGKTIDGIQYGDLTQETVFVLKDEKPFDFS